MRRRYVRGLRRRTPLRRGRVDNVNWVTVQPPKKGSVAEFQECEPRLAHLLIEFYRDTSATRQAELSDCLRKNIENPCIESIHVFGNAEHLELLPTSDKLIKNVSASRMTYARFFAYAASHLENKVCAIANADIYFDHTMALVTKADLKNRFLCLTRWDVTGKGPSVFMNRPDSADVWIFESPMRLVQQPEFFLGLPGCDNKIAFIAAEAGYRLENPSRTVMTHHLHLTNKRNYTQLQRVPGPYLHVWPTHMSLKT